MPKTWMKGALLLVFAALIVAVGCGKDNKTASTGATGGETKVKSEQTAESKSDAKSDDKAKEQKTVELTVATVGENAVYGPIYLAQEKGIFEKHGLKVKLMSFDPSASTAALVSGDVQVVAGGPAIVDAAIKTDKVRVIGTEGKIAFSLFAKNISKLEELKGKTIGATSAGGSADTAARTLIRAIGMELGKDVKVLYTGSNPATFAAIKEGKIEAGVISPPTTIQAEQMGLKEVANLAEVKGVLGLYGVLGVNQPFAEKNPKAIEEFMKAYSEATKLTQTDKASTKAALSKYTKATDDQVLEVSYEAYKKYWPVDLHLPNEEIQFILDELGSKNPAAKSKKPADVMDNRYADAVK